MVTINAQWEIVVDHPQDVLWQTCDPCHPSLHQRVLLIRHDNTGLVIPNTCRDLECILRPGHVADRARRMLAAVYQYSQWQEIEGLTFHEISGTQRHNFRRRVLGALGWGYVIPSDDGRLTVCTNLDAEGSLPSRHNAQVMLTGLLDAHHSRRYVSAWDPLKALTSDPRPRLCPECSSDSDHAEDHLCWLMTPDKHCMIHGCETTPRYQYVIPLGEGQSADEVARGYGVVDPVWQPTSGG